MESTWYDWVKSFYPNNDLVTKDDAEDWVKLQFPESTQ